MKFIKFNIIILCSIVLNQLHAQDTLTVNIDDDAILDKVWFDFQDDEGYINVALSSSKEKIRSQPLGDPSGNIHFKEAKNGFLYHVNFMRSGYSVQFRYNAKTMNVEAIGLNNYSFGNAANDGSGESSVNLNTNKYIGNWHYYDDENEELMSMSPIRKSLKIGTKDLNDFDGSIVSIFTDQCAVWYQEAIKKGH